MKNSSANDQEMRELVGRHFPGVPRDEVAVKAMTVFRRDAFRGLLTDFILHAREAGAARVLAIRMCRASPAAGALVSEYAERFFPALNCLVVDENGAGFVCREGRQELVPGRLPVSRAVPSRGAVASGNLFTPNGQWFLKVLLLDGLAPRYWGGPNSDGGVRGVSQLAELADKPQSSVSQFVHVAESEGYLVRDPRGIRIQRIRQLLAQWGYYLLNHPDRSFRVKSLYPGEGVSDALRRISRVAGAAVGGHAAAHAHGVAVVSVERARVFVPDVRDAIEQLQVVESDVSEDAFRLLVPKASDAVFGGAVRHGESPVVDILQVYLDLFGDPVRGREQAEHVLERVLEPHWERCQWL